MKKVIIVHGSPIEGEDVLEGPEITYNKHWMPWLKEELEKKDYEVFTPLMPNPVEPIYEDWKKEFEKISVNEDTILIGHSAGTTFLVHWLSDTRKKVAKLILVAPWKIPFRDSKLNETFCNYEIEKDIKNNVGEIIYFSSNDEEEDGKKSLKIFYNALGGKIIELKNHGHFCLGDMGTEEFPELFAEVLK